MKTRIPLYAKIVMWFFVNLAVLFVAGWLLVRGQFQVSGFSARVAGDRVQNKALEIMAELNTVPSEKWDEILKKHAAPFGVRFFLYDNNGRHLAGPTQPLIPEIHNRLVGARPPLRMDNQRARPPFEGRRPPGLEDRPPRPERFEFQGGPPDRPQLGQPPAQLRGQSRELPDKLFIPTTKPDRYWVLVRVEYLENQTKHGGAILAESDSPTGGGLYFDVVPLLWAGAGVLVLSALIWLPFVRGITRSLSRMSAATAQLAEGNFEARANEKRRDELGALGGEINRMAARLAGYVGGQKRFLGDVAHELCAPTARLQVAVSILEQRATTDDDRERLADVREEVEHMASLVNELLQFSRASIGGKKVELQSVNLRSIAEKAIHREAGDTSQVSLDIDAELHARAEPDLLLRAVSNLLRNAIRYAGHAGPIVVSAVRDGADVFFSVTDSGPGIPADALPKIFDPFYRVDTARTPGQPGQGGTGLGLAIVKTCVEACSGSVVAHNVQPNGLEVTLRLRAT